jgi:hypothetical protein
MPRSPGSAWRAPRTSRRDRFPPGSGGAWPSRVGRDRPAPPRHGALLWHQQPGANAQERGLAGAIRPGDVQQLTCGGLERNAAQHVPLAAPYVQALR